MNRRAWARVAGALTLLLVVAGCYVAALVSRPRS
jgi:hypothetical protein